MAEVSRSWRRARSSATTALVAVLGLVVSELEAVAAGIVRYIDSRGTITFYYRPDPEYVPRTGDDSASSAERENSLMPLIQRIADEYQVDPVLVRAVMRVESDFHPDAVSRKGAKGLMQLMPATAQSYGVDDVFDIEQNIRGGVSFLRHLQDRYGDDLRTLLAAYNAGETAVERAGRDVPAFSETQQYVVDVLHHFEKRGGLLGAKIQPAVARVPSPSRASVRAAPAEPPARPVRIHFDSHGNLVITNVP